MGDYILMVVFGGGPHLREFGGAVVGVAFDLGGRVIAP